MTLIENIMAIISLVFIVGAVYFWGSVLVSIVKELLRDD